MPDGDRKPGSARACAQLGFPERQGRYQRRELSGGEKARLLMGLATFNGPHLLILDEPTNHLDIDSRAALIEAINDYEGAIILVSHDRHLLEACADRLWLVADGTVKAFDGDIDDYRRFVLERAATEGPAEKRSDDRPIRSAERREAAKSRRDAAPLKKRIDVVDERMKKFEDLLARIDAALAEPDAFTKDPGKAAGLAQNRAELAKALAAAEEEWLELTSAYEAAG